MQWRRVLSAEVVRAACCPPLFTFESCDEKSAFDDVTGISGDAVSGRGVASLEQTSTEGGEATRTL